MSGAQLCCIEINKGLYGAHQVVPRTLGLLAAALWLARCVAALAELTLPMVVALRQSLNLVCPVDAGVNIMTYIIQGRVRTHRQTQFAWCLLGPATAHARAMPICPGPFGKRTLPQLLRSYHQPLPRLHGLPWVVSMGGFLGLASAPCLAAVVAGVARCYRRR